MKALRIDRKVSPAAGEALACELGDQRQEPRYVPTLERAYLGWWEGESFRTALGRLANISAGGAALDVRDDPGVGETVWLCVVGPNRMGWVAARLLGRHGTIIRMVFAERFPYELFKSVVWGLPADEAPPDDNAAQECLETSPDEPASRREPTDPL